MNVRVRAGGAVHVALRLSLPWAPDLWFTRCGLEEWTQAPGKGGWTLTDDPADCRNCERRMVDREYQGDTTFSVMASQDGRLDAYEEGVAAGVKAAIVLVRHRLAAGSEAIGRYEITSADDALNWLEDELRVIEKEAGRE